MSKAPEQTLETVKDLPAQVTWADQRPTRNGVEYGTFFTIDLEGQAFDQLVDAHGWDGDFVVPASFSGSIEHGYFDDVEVRIMKAGQLDVEPQFRRNHLGEILSKALAYIAVEQGCEAIELQFSHPASIMIFRKIFGDDRFQFFQDDEFDPEEEVPLDITVDEALDMVVAQRQRVIEYGVSKPFGGGIATHQPETDDDILVGSVEGVSARIDLKGFNASSIEPPLQVQSESE